MPVKFRDYYETLGVTKTAGADDLRKAFRKLARKYHPDVAKDKKGAEDKFKEINEAYEVLSDPEKRRKYDALGADWQQHERAGGGGGGGGPFPGGHPFFRPGGGGGRGRGGNAREYEFDGSTGFSDFFEQFFGGAATARGRAGGFGVPPGSAEAARGQDTEADLMVTLEEALNGGRRGLTLRRGDDKTESIEVKIPANVHEGQRIRLRGRGEGGGDLYLRVRLAKHPDFRVEENGDVHHDLSLTAPEAVLGVEKSVPTPDGGRGKLKIAAGSQPGQRFRLRGKGMPGPGGARGDLYVALEVELPREVTPEARALWEKLRAS